MINQWQIRGKIVRLPDVGVCTSFFWEKRKITYWLISSKTGYPPASANWCNKFWSQPLQQVMIWFFFKSLCSYEPHCCPHPSLVEQLQPASVAVISADLAVRLVEAGWVAEGRWDGVEVRDGDGVPWRRSQGPGVTLGNGRRWRAVILIRDSGRSSPGPQGLPLRQLVS